MSAVSWMSVVWFVVVLAMVPVGLWLLKRSGMAGPVGRLAGGGPRLTGSLAVGPQQRVVTVEVGEGSAKRWLVLGVTPQQITTLVRSTAPLVVPAPGDLGATGAARSTAATGFSQVLTQALGRRSPQPDRDGDTHRPDVSAPASSRPRGRRSSRTTPGGLSTLAPVSDFSSGRREGAADPRLVALRDRLARGG